MSKIQLTFFIVCGLAVALAGHVSMTLHFYQAGFVSTAALFSVTPFAVAYAALTVHRKKKGGRNA